MLRRPWRRGTGFFVVLTFDNGRQSEQHSESEQMAKFIPAASDKTHRKLLVEQDYL